MNNRPTPPAYTAAQWNDPRIIDYQPSVQFRKYLKVYLRLGIAQVVFAILAILIAIIKIIQGYPNKAVPIICAAFFLTSGILGIVSGKNGKYCPVVGSMVMAIFSSVVAANLAVLSIYLLMTATTSPNYFIENFTEYTVLEAILLSTALCQFFVSIFHAIYCCVGTCCEAKRQQPVQETILDPSYGNPMLTTGHPNVANQDQFRQYLDDYSTSVNMITDNQDEALLDLGTEDQDKV